MASHVVLEYSQMVVSDVFRTVWHLGRIGFRISQDIKKKGIVQADHEKDKQRKARNQRK